MNYGPDIKNSPWRTVASVLIDAIDAYAAVLAMVRRTFIDVCWNKKRLLDGMT
jgi:hypothetical protein